MCGVCKNRLPKKQLFRFTKDEDKFIFTKTKQSGRGVYICEDCLKNLDSKSASRAFRCKISDEEANHLKEVLIDREKTKSN